MEQFIMEELALPNKKNLKEFLFYNGALIAKPELVDLKENVFVIYYQSAVVTNDLEILKSKNFYDKDKGDLLFAVPKEKLPVVEG